MRSLCRLRFLAILFAVLLAEQAARPQAPGQLHVLAVGVDAAGTQVSSIVPTRLGVDTRQLVSMLQQANVADVHLLVNEATVRSEPAAPDPIDIELDRMQPALGVHDTLLVVLGARMYGRDGQFFIDLDKYGTDFTMAHLLVRLRRLPCDNVVLVLPAIMGTALELNFKHYLESFPAGTGAANIDLFSATQLTENGMHSPLLAAIGAGLLGQADADHDGVITSTELEAHLIHQAFVSRPDALARMDPSFVDRSWTSEYTLYGTPFPVISRAVQARVSGEPSPPVVAATPVTGPPVKPPPVAAAAANRVRGSLPDAAPAIAAPQLQLPRTYAVLFATNHYEHWPALGNPIADAGALQALLRDTYGVQTELVPDPTADDVIETLLRYIAKSYENNAQIIVFFAGHGYFAEDAGVGYLVTRESKMPSVDPAHRSLLSFDDIQRYVDRIPAKHILLLMDSCFSGTFDRKLADAATRDEGVDRIYAPRPLAQVLGQQSSYPTRRFITSGGKEYVPDGRPGEHSPFTRALLQTLTRDADEHGYTRWRDLQAGLESVQPSPHWGSMGDRDDLNGDLILLTPAMREKLLAGVPAAAPPTPTLPSAAPPPAAPRRH